MFICHAAYRVILLKVRIVVSKVNFLIWLMPLEASTYCWFCIMCKPRLKCSLGSLARLSTLS